MATVLAFLEATESLCAATDVVTARCKTAMATIDEAALECEALMHLFAEADCFIAHAHKLAGE